MFQSAWNLAAEPLFAPLPKFNESVFHASFENSQKKLAPIVHAAALAGQSGKSIAATSMESVLKNPCEKTAAPGCVIP